MVTRTQLMQTGGIASLQKRKQEQKIPEVIVPKVSQAEIEAQKKYEQELSKYNQDMAEYGASQLVYMWATRGREDMIAGLSKHGTPAEKKVAEEYLKGVWKRGEALSRQPIPPTIITIGTSASKVVSPEQVFTKKNVYDIATGTYTDSSGARTSMATPPKGATVVDSRLTTRTTTPSISVSKPTISYETQRYQDLGYTKPQAEKLARESVSRGGMTFTPERAKEIIKPTVGEKIKSLYIATSPLLLGAKRDVETVSKSKKIVEDVKKAEKITLNLDRLSKEIEGIAQVNINEEGEWTGSERALDDYNKRVEEYEKEIEKYKKMGAVIDEEGNIIEPTVKVGYLGLTKEEPISRYKGLSSFWKAVPTQIDLLGAEYSATIGKAIEKTGLTFPEREIKYKGTMLAPYSSGTTQVDPLTGQKNLFIDVEGTYIRPEVKPEEIGEKVYQIGKGGVSFGKYAIPGVGLGLFAGETIGTVQEAGGIKKYIKEKPVEAALTGALILGGGIFAGTRYLTKVRPTTIPGGFKYSTRAQDLFGTRLRISKEGVKTLPSKRFEYKVFREKLTPSGEREFLGKIPQAKLQEEVLGETITYYDDITGTMRTVKEGSKVIVETPQGILYKGTPYGKLGKLEREKVVKFLEDQGYTQKQINEMLRLRQPKVLEEVFTGRGELIQAKEKSMFNLFGKLESKPILIETKGIPSRMGRGRVEFLRLTGKPIGESKGGLQLFKSLEESRKAYLTTKGYPYSKVSQAGRVKEIRYSETGVKEITPKELPPVKTKFVKRKEGEYALELEGAQFELLEGKQYKIFKDVSISKKVVPSMRKIQPSKGKVLVEEGEPLLKITDERIIETTGIQTRGRPEQVLKLVEKEELLTSTLLSLEKKPIIPPPKTKQIPILETKEYPLIVGGTGRVSSAYAGLGQYEVQESLGTVQLGIQLPQIMEKVKVKEIETISPREASVLKGIFKEKEIEKPKLDLIFKQLPKEVQKEVLGVKEIQKTRQAFAQLTKTEQVQLINLLRTKQVRDVIRPIEPKITPRIKLKTPLLKRLGKKAEEKELFKVFVTKKGKDVELDVFGTLKEARGKLKEELTQTLRAGGFISRGEKPLTFKEVGLFGEEFRPSKVSPYKVIQVKEKRLKKGGREAKEIQFFR